MKEKNGKNKLVQIWKGLTISRKLIIGFLGAILLGTVLLKMPFSLAQNKKIDFLEALFTIVSAVCVTGLSVVDVSKTFSVIGHSVILFFIQIGALGVMTFSTMLLVLIGKKMSYSTRELLKEERNSDSGGGITSFIRKLLLTVFIIEALGALILFFEFRKIMTMRNAIFYGIFHAVSAFCNAGFSLFSDSLEGFKLNPVINLTVAYLIIFGSMGFAVISSFIHMIRRGKNRFNLTTKLSIMMAVVLTVLGTVLFFVLEYNNAETLGNMNIFQKLMASFFQSVTFRTAGFNTVSLAATRPATTFISYVLMFIGASPGSTGGGVKTTTIGIIIYYIIGVLRKKENIEMFNRRIDWEIMNKALAIIMISLMYVFVVTTIILSLENFGIDRILYEVISAFATVGLSMDITPKLGNISRIILIITMFVGRLGPLTIALAFAEKRGKSSLKLPKEDILVG
ncbi:MAG: potassium transporter KtrB [Fusobacterium sp.]|nr:potassium transporter KtrB [Fusobacterium sp.]